MSFRHYLSTPQLCHYDAIVRDILDSKNNKNKNTSGMTKPQYSIEILNAFNSLLNTRDQNWRSLYPKLKNFIKLLKFSNDIRTKTLEKEFHEDIKNYISTILMRHSLDINHVTDQIDYIKETIELKVYADSSTFSEKCLYYVFQIPYVDLIIKCFI